MNNSDCLTNRILVRLKSGKKDENNEQIHRKNILNNRLNDYALLRRELSVIIHSSLIRSEQA